MEHNDSGGEGAKFEIIVQLELEPGCPVTCVGKLPNKKTRALQKQQGGRCPSFLDNLEGHNHLGLG